MSTPRFVSAFQFAFVVVSISVPLGCLNVQDAEVPSASGSSASGPEATDAIIQGVEFRLAMTDDTDVGSYDLTVAQVTCPGADAPVNPFNQTWALEVSAEPLAAGAGDPVASGSTHVFSQWAVPLAVGCYQAFAETADGDGGSFPGLPS